VAFKIRQNPFSAGGPRWGSSRRSPRPHSRLERGHPSPHATSLDTDPPSALAMRPPRSPARSTPMLHVDRRRCDQSRTGQAETLQTFMASFLASLLVKSEETEQCVAAVDVERRCCMPAATRTTSTSRTRNSDEIANVNCFTTTSDTYYKVQQTRAYTLKSSLQILQDSSNTKMTLWAPKGFFSRGGQIRGVETKVTQWGPGMEPWWV